MPVACNKPRVVLGEVDVRDLYLHDIAGLHHLARVLDEAVCELRHVHKAVLMYADVDECAEIGDLATTPSSMMPGCRSAQRLHPSLNVAVLNSGGGSRPGFSLPRCCP